MSTFIESASAYLSDRYDTREYGDRLAYVAPETGEAILVGPDALTVLGRYIQEGRDDAYSLWCADADIDERADASAIPDCDDVQGFRDEAAAAGDMVTVIAIDLLA